MTLTELGVRKAKATGCAANYWDLKAPGLVLRVQPSGHRSFKFVYSKAGDAQWYHVGTIGLSDARRIAAKLRLAVAEGKDPLAERQAQNGVSFGDLHRRYLNEHAKKKNKSWQQADYLIQRHVMPRWGNRDAKTITRADARALVASVKAPITANQALAAASAVFTWAVKQEVVTVNPCRGVDFHPTSSRDRILSDTEIKKVWDTIGSDAGLLEGSALKVILLTGQRPGEVSHMRREHVKDGWWEMPGQPEESIGWPGTKNAKSHRVWLTQEVRDILDTVDEAPDAGFVFVADNGGPVRGLDAAMRDICKKLKLPRATPHDLRRTFGSTVTALGHGRAAMDRILNHSDSGVGSVYDRHSYAAEDRRIMEAVTRHVTMLVEGRRAAMVVRGRF